MRSTAIIGAQWGDEGKGKIAHLLASDSEWVIRFNGGPNAGHTVVDSEGEIKFHHLPSGSLYEECKGVMGNGMVIDPLSLKGELEMLEEARNIQPEIYISGSAHLIMPYHPVLEILQKSKDEVGTTGRGIGPTYQDKAARSGFRFWDLLESDFPARFKQRVRRLREIWNDPEPLLNIDMDGYLDELLSFYRGSIKGRIRNGSFLANRALNSGDNVIFEGAQGTMLDIDFGTYPYVTSSNPTVGGIGTGAGVSPTRVERRLGVVKAYTTRVGKGPMVTEKTGPMGEKLRAKGDEFGATTGRPRRCGWLDLVALQYAVELNDFTAIVLTKLDVLAGFDTIKVATHYSIDGERFGHFPGSTQRLEKCKPVYRQFDGWEGDLSSCDNLEDLPAGTRRYIDFIERELEVPVEIVSIGKKKNDTLIVD
ncbi:MAG: adenylosuccinate synthase [Candidatus Bipolaricaulota bacterium]